MKHLASVVFVALISLLLVSCASAASVTSAVACSSLLVQIGEAEHLDADRAVADIRTVSAVCTRLQNRGAQ